MVKTRRHDRTGVKIAMLMAAAAIGLSACDTVKSTGMDPIDWYRDLSGESINDVQDQASNSKNLKEGSKEPYPNLASVPKQPDNAITKADREKLAQSLVADRQNAQYTDQQLHAGQNMQAVAPPPPETPPAPGPKVAAAPATAPAPAPSAAAARTTPPPQKMAAVPPVPVKQEVLPPPQAAAANPPAGPAPSPPPASARQAAAETPPSRAEVRKPDAHVTAKPKKDEATKKQAQAKRGSERPPEESALRPPSIGVMPAGEEARVAPPSPEEVAAATPARSDVEGARSGTVRAIEIDFAPGPFKARIRPADHNRLVDVAKLAQRSNARIRVVGYGGAPARGDSAEREFQSFNAALDNAKAVGIELAKLGVPANRIDIETKATVNSSDRAEVFVEQ